MKAALASDGQCAIASQMLSAISRLVLADQCSFAVVFQSIQISSFLTFNSFDGKSVPNFHISCIADGHFLKFYVDGDAGQDFSKCASRTTSVSLPQSVLRNNKHDVPHKERHFYCWLLTCFAHSL